MLEMKATVTNDGRSSARLERAAAEILMRYSWRRTIIRVLEALLRPLALLSKSNPPCDLDQVERILVFEPANLGDVVIILAPLLRSLRARFPRAHIAFLGKAKVEGFLRDQGLADELIPIQAPWAEHLSRWRIYNPFSLLWPRFAWNLIRLRRRHFDLAFPSGRSDIRHNLALWLTGAKRRVGYAYGGGRFLLTDVATPDLERPHVTDLSLKLLEHIGVPAARNGARLRVAPQDEEFAEEFLAEQGVNPDDLLIGIHPGARIPIRQWGEEHFKAVARRLTQRFGATIIWFLDPAQPAPNIQTQGMVTAALPLRQFLAVLSRCRLLVCNDSGPMHMAAGLGVPVVAVYGSTEPAWFGPLGPGHHIVIRQDIWCRPCGDRCIFPEPYCLTLISVEQVMQAVTEAIATSPGLVQCAHANRIPRSE